MDKGCRHRSDRNGELCRLAPRVESGNRWRGNRGVSIAIRPSAMRRRDSHLRNGQAADRPGVGPANRRLPDTASGKSIDRPEPPGSFASQTPGAIPIQGLRGHSLYGYLRRFPIYWDHRFSMCLCAGVVGGGVGWGSDAISPMRYGSGNAIWRPACVFSHGSIYMAPRRRFP